MRIKEVHARIIKNSRAEDAIQVTINKAFSASAPSGASTGKHEVPIFSRKGIQFAVKFINKYHFQNLTLEEFNDVEVFDKFGDVLGGNPVVALQFAALKAMSNNRIYSFLNPKAKHMPIPLGNCVGGGAHTKLPSTDIQEYLLIPKAKTIRERIVINTNLYKEMGKQLKSKHKTDEGAFIPSLSTEETFDAITDILDKSGTKAQLGVDIAATQLYKDNGYHYKNFSQDKKHAMLTRHEQIDKVNGWIRDYNLGYVEDPLEEEDFDGFSKISRKTLVCGDDLITTNEERLKIALKKHAVNAIIVKPNQIGSLIKTKRIVDLAKKHDIATVISHRSGETLDASIAHLAVAWNMPYIKTGIFGKEREVKLQELLRIERAIL